MFLIMIIMKITAKSVVIHNWLSRRTLRPANANNTRLIAEVNTLDVDNGAVRDDAHFSTQLVDNSSR